MGRKYTKKEKVLVLRHDVILGSKYELLDVVIPLDSPDSHGDVFTNETKISTCDTAIMIHDHITNKDKE
jgi:hypothetical protein